MTEASVSHLLSWAKAGTKTAIYALLAYYTARGAAFMVQRQLHLWWARWAVVEADDVLNNFRQDRPDSYTGRTDRLLLGEAGIVEEIQAIIHAQWVRHVQGVRQQIRSWRNPLITPADYQQWFESQFTPLAVQFPNWVPPWRDRLVMQLGDLSVMQPHEIYQQCLRHLTAVVADAARSPNPIAAWEVEAARDTLAAIRASHVPRNHLSRN